MILRIFKQNYQVSKGPHRLEPGQRVNVFVRPETIELVKAIDEDSLKASVMERSFLGEKVDYLLDLDGHPIYATSYDPLRHGTFSLHQEVRVRFNPEAITILKEVK